MVREYDERETIGPFSGPRPRDRPWEAQEIDGGPFERRRGTDRRGLEDRTDAQESSAAEASDRRGHWGRRKADVLRSEESLTRRSRALIRRFREPLIGLTLAGVAAPLINAGMEGPAGEAARADADGARTAATGGEAVGTTDIEGSVGEAWADAEAEVVREATIEGAVTRYGIDRGLAQQIFDAAEKHAIEPDMAYGLVNTESTFRDRAVSHVGARGLTQLMPRTAKWLEPGVSTSDLFNRDVNLELGFRYLRQLIDKYDGDAEKALTAYNRGPGTVDRILRRGGNPDNGYAGKVLGG